MPVVNPKFQTLLTELTELLTHLEFQPSWSDVANITELSETDIIEQCLLWAADTQTEAELSTLYDAFDYLLHCTLLELMIQVRHGHRAAIQAWERLQQTLIEILQQALSHTELITLILDHISNHSLPLSAHTLDTIIEWQQHTFEPTLEESSLSSEDINQELMKHLDQLHITSEFEFYQLFADRLAYFSDSAIESFMYDLLGAEQSLLREGALLFILHKRNSVRWAVLQLLQDVFFQKRISSTSLRRLITLRNWLADDEKTLLDKTIRAVRKTGLACEPAATPQHIKLLQVHASTVDGVGASSVLCLFQVGRKYALVGSIFKELFGVLDTWASPLTTRKECEAQIRHMKEEIYSLECDENWLREVLPHFLALNVRAKEPITAETLLWIEWLGLNSWQPQPINARRLLQRWQTEFPQYFLPKITEKAHQSSLKWFKKYPFTHSWFEQDDALEQRLRDFFTGNLPVATVSAIDYLFEPYREKWFERLVFLALWARHNQKNQGPVWYEFAIIAQALLTDELRNIAFMQTIAQHTIDYYSQVVFTEELNDAALQLQTVPSKPSKKKPSDKPPGKKQ